MIKMILYQEVHQPTAGGEDDRTGVAPGNREDDAKANVCLEG